MAALSCRLPRRESRWGCCSPLGRSMGAVPALAGVVLLVREAPDVAGQGEDLGGGEESDALDLGERRPAGSDRGSELLLEVLDRGLVTLEVAHDVAGELLALVVSSSHGANFG